MPSSKSKAYTKPEVSDVDLSPVAQGILLVAQELRVEAAQWERRDDESDQRTYADGLRAAAAKFEGFAKS